MTFPARLASLLVLTALAMASSGCYLFDFFKKKKSQGGDEPDAVFTGQVIGQPLGQRAGGPNEALLASLYGVPTVTPPAPIRPDPDVYIRRLLRQYRPEGATVARQIGRIEPYRMLLGGASEDFAKAPQEEYDATSLLAVFKVAEEVCRALVAPNGWEHEGWSTILPYEPDAVTQNVAWLAQRFIGIPTAELDPEIVPSLIAIMDAEAPALQEQGWARNNPYASYVPACATLALDAEALYL